MAAKQVSRTLGWILMGLVMVGLVGFGATNFGGSLRSVGTVGDTEIDADRYFRDLNNALRSFEAGTGQQINMETARAIGLDQQTLGRLIATVALENETARLGISVGDAEIRNQVVEIDSFKGVSGTFDRQAYDFALQQSGLTAREFEASLRDEVARTILQGAVTSGVVMQPAYTTTLYAHAREERNFTWAALGLDALEVQPATPTDDELAAYYEANPNTFTLPQTKHLSYVWLDPETIIPTIEVSEEDLQALYAARSEEYQVPERRIVERLVFATGEDAQTAVDRLTAGEVDFEALVAERGLALADTDMGDVTQAALGDAGDAVFALIEPGSVSLPVNTNLGPALFRMNAILDAQETTLDQVRDDLQGELAADAARRQVEALIPEFDDLLAGGATLEELAEIHGLTLSTLDWSAGASDGIAAYDSFREIASVITVEDYPEVTLMSDSGLFALRADSIDAPRLQELDEVRDQAIAGWKDGEALRLLTLQADAMLEKFAAGETPATLGLTEIQEEGQTRDAFIDGTPPAFVTDVFDMTVGNWRVMQDATGVIVVRLDAVNAADQASDDAVLVKEAFNEQMAQEVALDVQAAFSATLQTQAGITLNRQVIDAVNSQFP